MLFGWASLIIILVFLFFMGLLSVPLTFEARGYTGKRKLEVKLAWCWGLLAAAILFSGGVTTFKLCLAGKALPVSHRKLGADSAGKIRKKDGRKQGRRKFNLSAAIIFLDKNLLTIIIVYLKKLFKSLNLRLRLNGAIGVSDPALTGLFAGLITMLHAGHLNFNLRPNFNDPVFDIKGEIAGLIKPIVILWLTVQLLLTKKIRNFWWGELRKRLF